MLDLIHQIDVSLLLWLNGFHSHTADIIMWHISGKYQWIPFYIVILYFVLRKYKWESWIYIAAILITFILTEQASNLVKILVQRARPSHNPEIEGLLHIVNQYRGGKFGFVSSHAANTFGLATMISLLLEKKTWFFAMFFWASIVSYSRIYLGVHYPTDILCGAVLGILSALVVYRGLTLLKIKKAPEKKEP